MADEVLSTVHERVMALPFGMILGLGALSGVFAAALGGLTVERSASGSPATSVAAETTNLATDPTAASPGAGPDGDAAAKTLGGGASAVDGDGPAGSAAAVVAGEEPAEDDPEHAGATADPEAAGEAAAAGDDPEESAEDEDEVEIEDTPPDVGASADAAAPKSDEAPSPTAATPPPASDRDREAEAQATPDELYSMAKDAYEAGEYKDAYRLATRSQRARPADRTQMLRGRAACRIKDEKNAKEVVKSFKLGDERRKTLRTFCKERGVRVGL